jgi:pimeloyl-ACP methyl ester carboxylesterase
MGPLTQFRRNDLVFDVRDHGPGDGEAVVLLHGFPQDGTCFDAVVPALQEAGLRTLVPDQRGYSPGARPTGRRDYVLEQVVADVLALLDTADVERAHVVGHDWGGAVAWALAARHPQRVRSLVALSTPHPTALLKSMTRSTQALHSWYMALFQLPGLPEALVTRRFAASLRRQGLPAAAADHYAARMAEPGAATGALNWYRAMPFSRMVATPKVRVPTTYAWGEKDFALGRAAAEMTADYVTGPYCFEVLSAGHWLPEVRPDQVASLILGRVRDA